MDRKGARGVTRSLVDMKGLLTPIEFPFFQVEIDSKFRHRLSHHIKEEFPILHKIALFLVVHRNLGRFILKDIEAFKMVWMRMGHDDQIDLFWRNPISFHLIKEMGKMSGMTRIDENGLFSLDYIGVAVVFIWILPKIGIKVFFKFHPNERLLTGKCPTNPGVPVPS
jgi:hypothetical protein